MKTNRRFWVAVLASFAVTVIGYLGFLGLTPEKSSGAVVPLILLCSLMVVTGVAFLVGALVYVIFKRVVERRSRKVES